MINRLQAEMRQALAKKNTGRFHVHPSAGLPTVMRQVRDPALFPEIVLDPAKDEIYISVDKDTVVLACLRQGRNLEVV